jgi:conjugal transfer pilus assembly protein TraW
MKNNTEQPVSTTSHTFRRISVIVALVLFALATSAFLSRVVLEYSTPRVVAFDMKKTLDSFMDSVSQKQLTEAQSKALSDRFNDALEKSLAEYQQQHHGHSGFTCRGSGRARCDPQHPARHCPPDERRTVMIRLKDCLLAACLVSPLTQAADLGTWGDLWPVREQDMLQLITQRLQSLQSSGQWDQTMDAFKQRVIENSQRPAPVEGIKRAEKYEQRWFDPSIRLTEDLKDNEGRVFARKGDVVNPLKTVPFVQTLYFINGDDADQLAWMKRQVPETLMSKIILVRGSIPDTSAALDSRIYFDQNGVLSKRFGLTAVPARITPAPSGERLNIEVFPVR